MTLAESAFAALYRGLSVAEAEPTGYVASRLTSMGLSPDIQVGQSAEITSDRAPRGDIRTDASGVGDIGFELLHTHLNDMWGYLLQTAGIPTGFAFGPDVGGWTITNAATNPNLEGAVGWTLGVSAGMALSFPASDNWSANAGKIAVIKRIIDSDNAELVCHSGHLANESGDGVWRSSTWKNGTTKRELWVEKLLRDPTGPGTITSPISLYTEQYKNAVVASCSHSFRPGQAAAPGTFSIQSGFPTIGTTRLGTTTITQVGAAKEPMNSLDQVQNIWVQPSTIASIGTDYSGLTSEFSWNYNNNVQRDAAVGAFGAINVRLGIPSITGTLNLFIENNQEMLRLVNNTTLALSIVVKDDDGDYLIFSCTAAKFGTGGTPINSAEDAAFQNLGWSGRDWRINSFLASEVA